MIQSISNGSRTACWLGNLLVVCMVPLAFACSPKSEYHRKVAAELASGKTVDSLFLGTHFGMTSKEFYAHCWDMNQKGIIGQGLQNTTALYKLKEGFRGNVSMDFYPNFYEDRIYEMPVNLVYDAWSPWNKALHADSLQVEVLQMFEKWYGQGFLKVISQDRGTAYVKVDGNRRITIYTEDEMNVRVMFKDLRISKQLGDDQKQG
ncbi:MAG: hypothetical protein AAGF85_05780 [Bacteroidota bacterium]